MLTDFLNLYFPSHNFWFFAGQCLCWSVYLWCSVSNELGPVNILWTLKICLTVICTDACSAEFPLSQAAQHCSLSPLYWCISATAISLRIHVAFEANLRRMCVSAFTISSYLIKLTEFYIKHLYHKQFW